MEKSIVYHGSNVDVAVPRILQNGFYKDFGYGFYCTNYEKQAKRWAMTKKGESVINRYEYELCMDLKILSFDNMTDEWLDFVAKCRMGIEHNYDIVEGFIDGRIPRKAFWELVKFNYPTHQIVFCTEEALKTLTFKGSDRL